VIQIGDVRIKAELPAIPIHRPNASCLLAGGYSG